MPSATRLVRRAITLIVLVLAATAMLPVASASAEPASKPGRPSIDSVVAGNAEVTVNWTAPEDDGGSPVTGYQVQVYIQGTGQVGSTVFDDPATTQVYTGLTNGVTYKFKVRAINAIGTGAPNLGYSDLVIPFGPPGSPTDVQINRRDETNVWIEWTPPASNGGSAITEYVITPIEDGVPLASIEWPATNLRRKVSGLTTGTPYTFKVAAKNSAGTSPDSAESASVIPAGKPGSPTIGTVTPGDGEVTVNWEAPLDEGGVPVTGYQVEAYAQGTGQVGSMVFDDPNTTQVYTGLTNGVTYKFQVRAINEVGIGAASEISELVTPAGQTTKPGRPTIGAVEAGDGEVTLNWTAPEDDGGSPVTGYQVQVYIQGTGQVGSMVFDDPATTQVYTGLTNGVTYKFKVRAINAIGTGAPNLGYSDLVIPFGDEPFGSVPA